MCGIAGIISQEPIAPEDLQRLRAANSLLRHRGPDGDGEFVDSHVALAMRRLSIIDLAGAWQPIYNEDRSLAIVANGEIYNYVELRKLLEARGHRLTTSGDIETILHLYEEYGLDCVQHLRGMFAFALWDSKQRRLILARDRMGEKPLYLHEKAGQIVFASEMKALLQSGIVPFELDADAVNLYFHYQYVPEPLTPIKGVRKLDAAHLLVINVDPWCVEEKCYWRMEDAPPLTGDPATLIRAQLEQVSEIVIRSDVPVGVALSGGLDSSAIAALAARKYPGTMQAFCVGYPGHPDNDERRDARALADHLELPFHDVELATGDMVSFFPELVYWRDDPIADIAGFGYYAVMKLAREHGVPVVLQGQGGDELFWGYSWVRDAAQQTARKQLLRGTNALFALPHYLGLSLPTGVSRYELWQWTRQVGGLRPGWQNFRRDRSSSRNQIVFYDASEDFSRAATGLQELYTSAFREQLNGSSAAKLFTIDEPWPSIDIVTTKLICDTYLRENGVAQGDRLSMASSIELRLPLLDYRLVETVIGLRKTRTDLNEPAKAWLNSAISDLLPDWVVKRPKRGFNPPVREWQAALFSVYGESLADGLLVQLGVLARHCAEGLADRCSPTGDDSIAFKMLVLEYWCRQMCCVRSG